MTTTLILPNESFLSEGIILTCKQSTNGCKGCSRSGSADCNYLLCSGVHRSDYKSVIFIEAASMIIAGKIVEIVVNEGCGKCAFSDMDEANEPCRGCTGKTMYYEIKRNN